MGYPARIARQLFLISLLTVFYVGGVVSQFTIFTNSYIIEDLLNKSRLTNYSTSYDVNTLPSTYDIEIPYYQQLNPVWCGPACLEMLFDYYGPDIDQAIIADVAAYDLSGTFAEDLLRAAHYSYASDVTNIPPEGYGVRRLGFPAYSVHWEGNYSAISTSVKTLLSNDVPILILTHYDTSHEYGHFRVLKGYDDATNVFITHDPWYTGQYQGPDETFDQSLLINDLWMRYDRWGMIIQPMELQISCSVPIIQSGSSFNLTAEIAMPCPDPFSRDEFLLELSFARVLLPPGFSLAEGSDTILLDLNIEIQEVGWLINSPAMLSTNVLNITVEAGGYVNGYGVSAGPYSDIVGSEATITLGALPSMNNILVLILVPLAIILIVIVIIVLKKQFSQNRNKSIDIA